MPAVVCVWDVPAAVWPVGHPPPELGTGQGYGLLLFIARSTMCVKDPNFMCLDAEVLMQAEHANSERAVESRPFVDERRIDALGI